MAKNLSSKPVNQYKLMHEKTRIDYAFDLKNRLQAHDIMYEVSDTSESVDSGHSPKMR